MTATVPNAGVSVRASRQVRTGLATAALLAPLVCFLLAGFAAPMVRLAALSLSSADGPLQPYADIAGSPVYRQVFLNTLTLALAVSAWCVLLAYPTAYMLSRLSGWRRSAAFCCVLLPLWISVLVRTFAWVLLLETNGPVNKLLVATHATGSPLPLLFNTVGVQIGMVHVLLPYALLPILTVMRGVDGRLLLASDSLGAGRLATFLRIYAPLSLPGVLAGFLLVFLLALGFFITPAILGGPGNMTIAMLIDQFVNERLVWPLAAAASFWLLALIVLLLLGASRFVDVLNAVVAR